MNHAPVFCPKNISVEQCVNVKFLVTLGKPLQKFFFLLKEMYGDECRWKRCDSDDLHLGHPHASKSDANIENMAITTDMKNYHKQIQKITL